MTSRAQACACHDHLGSARTAVLDDVLEKLRSVSIPSISLILRRLGYLNTFLSGLVPRTSAQGFAGRALTARATHQEGRGGGAGRGGVTAPPRLRGHRAWRRPRH